jgi:hypothetical protein
MLGEKILQIIFCDVVGEVSYEQLCIHSFTVILEITPAKRAQPLGSASDLYSYPYNICAQQNLKLGRDSPPLARKRQPPLFRFSIHIKG